MRCWVFPPEIPSHQEAISYKHYNGLNLTPSKEGFELYRYKKNTYEMATRGWSGLY